MEKKSLDQIGKKMKYIVVILYLSYFIVATNGIAFAYNYSCIDIAKTTNEINNCGNQIVPQLELKIEEKFKRLDRKYKNNIDMQKLLHLTKQSWMNYRNLLWNFEGAAFAGGQTKGILPIEANKAYLKCVIETLEEMDSHLTKWENCKVIVFDQ